MSIFSCRIPSKTTVMENSDRQAKYLRAKERVEELKKFHGNLFSYIVVNSVLALINYYTNGFAYMWFLWSVFGWGIGLIFHALNTFDLNPFCGKQWEKRKMEEFMNEYDESENGNDHGRFQ